MYLRRFYKVCMLIGIGFFASLLYYHDSTLAGNVSTKIISVTLYNSYSGSLSWSSGNVFFTSGGMLWSSGTTVGVDVSATAGSTYSITGDYYGVLTGIGTGVYLHTHYLPVSTGDGIKSFQSLFERGYEPYDSETISYMLDTTSPSIPTSLLPLNNALISGQNVVNLQWGASYDSGVGLSGYRIHLSLHPSFIGEIVVDTIATGIQFLSGQLPAGTLYRYVDAIDYLGNTSSTLPTFFHYITPTTITPGGGGGVGGGGGGGYAGGGGMPVIDYCPYGDTSLTTTDGLCKNPISNGTGIISGLTGDNPTPGIGSGLSSGSLPNDNINNGNIPLSGSLAQYLVQGYNLAQQSRYIDMILPTTYYWTSNKIHRSSPIIYQSLLKKYLGKDYIPPIGYLTIYLSWFLLLLFFLQKVVKKVLKYLTKYYIKL